MHTHIYREVHICMHVPYIYAEMHTTHTTHISNHAHTHTNIHTYKCTHIWTHTQQTEYSKNPDGSSHKWNTYWGEAKTFLAGYCSYPKWSPFHLAFWRSMCWQLACSLHHRLTATSPIIPVPPGTELPSKSPLGRPWENCFIQQWRKCMRAL